MNMKMKTAVLAALTLTFAAVTAEAEVHKRPYRGSRTPEQLAEWRRLAPMRNYGGMVRKEGSAYGKVVFLNAQKLIPAATIGNPLKRVEDRLNLLWEVKDVASVKLANPSGDIKAAGGAVGVVIAESDELPALVTAPEDGWAIVNVAALNRDKPDAAKLAERTNKELLRAFALIGGAAFQSRDPIVMRADIRTPQELDLIKSANYGIDTVDALRRNLPFNGVMPWKITTYRQACQEGWAPQPTNEYQKAIWDKVHELPTNPLPLKKPTK